jgi:hypothetical protein
MPLLKRSGVRSPWFPAPLPTPSADPPRPLLITRGAQPLPSGQMTWLRSEHDAWLFDCDAAASPSRIHAALAAFL